MEPSSPGAEAGFTRGDVVTELDGKPIQYVLEQMRVVFRTDGRQIVTVERGGKKVRLTLELKRQL